MKKIYEYIKLSLEERQQHLRLDTPCHLRGTISTQLRGLLAYYLDTDIGKGIDCCHACNNSECSNPQHLYWGTRSENMNDLYASDCGDILKKQISNRMLGEKNVNFNIKPWKVNTAIINDIIKESWKKSQYIYEHYFLLNWDITKYGQGRTYFYSKYNIGRGTFYTMFNMFKNGWIPNKDEEWLELMEGCQSGLSEQS